jgi:hypothetical protein
MLTVLVGLVLVGVVLYLVETYIPMSPPIRTVLRVVVVIFLILWLVQIFGLDAGLPRLR